MATFNAVFTESGGTFGAKFDASQTVESGDYNVLSNKPKINGVELIGDKSGPELKLQNKMDVLSQTDIEKILYLG